MGSRGGGRNRAVVGGRVTVQVRKGASNLGFSAMLTQKRAGRIRLVIYATFLGDTAQEEADMSQ